MSRQTVTELEKARWLLSICGVLIVLVLLSGCEPGYSDGPEAVEALAADVGAALNAGDSERLGALFADDGIFVSGAAPAATGRNAIVARYGESLRYLDYDVALRADETTQLGEVATQHGTLSGTVTVTTSDAKLPVEGQFIHVARRQAGGGWSISRAGWFFDTPAAEGKSCPSASSCCCKSISASDCVVKPATGCAGTTRPIPIVTP